MHGPHPRVVDSHPGRGAPLRHSRPIKRTRVPRSRCSPAALFPRLYTHDRDISSHVELEISRESCPTSQPPPPPPLGFLPVDVYSTGAWPWHSRGVTTLIDYRRWLAGRLTRLSRKRLWAAEWTPFVWDIFFRASLSHSCEATGSSDK